MIEELAAANESEGGGTIVVLSEEDKETIEVELDARLGKAGLRGSSVVVRSGSPMLVQVAPQGKGKSNNNNNNKRERERERKRERKREIKKEHARRCGRPSRDAFFLIVATTREVRTFHARGTHLSLMLWVNGCGPAAACAQDLVRVSADRARSVLVLAQEGDADRADAKTLRTVLALKSFGHGLQGHVVAEIRDVDNEALVRCERSRASRRARVYGSLPRVVARRLTRRRAARRRTPLRAQARRRRRHRDVREPRRARPADAHVGARAGARVGLRRGARVRRRRVLPQGASCVGAYRR